MSSAEAECNAGAAACMSMSHFRMILNELNGNDVDKIWDPPILMLSDSQSAVTITNSDRDVKSLRHCKRRLMYMRQLRKEKELRFEHVSNEYMLADGGTKNLDAVAVKRLNNILMTKVTP